MLSIMYAYLQRGAKPVRNAQQPRQYLRPQSNTLDTHVMYSRNLLSGSTALLRRKLNWSTSTCVAFSEMVDVEIGMGSFARKLP